ncbi:MAG: SAP domain-containing protein [Acutalibacteraceae bacterium]|nr:SAP domain-containing protein [Acutalibacteraceae bacterium]
MYHLRLCKALSYTGVVSATRKEPDVFTEDKAIADKALASGYFQLVEDDGRQTATVKGHLSKEQLESMKVSDLKKLAEAMGIDTSGIEKKAELVEAISAEEVEAPAEEENEVDYEGLSDMTKAELTAYAAEHGISLEGCNTKADMLSTISVANGGSYTMIDLQKE